jgi:primosomal protein N'
MLIDVGIRHAFCRTLGKAEEGHHEFPKARIARLDRDTAIAKGHDFRAAERTFQLLTQIAGRAGRGSLPGIVLIQTINPDHYAIHMAAAQDYRAFYEKELQFRRMMHYPPFSAMANILVRSEQQEHFLTPAPEKIRILGPAEAPVTRLKNEYRYQFPIKAASRTARNSSRGSGNGPPPHWSSTWTR